MDMISNLLGNDERKRSEYGDFIGRYEQGSPYEGIRDDEAVERYRELAPSLSDDDYRESAESAFARLSPDERREFTRYLRDRAQSRGITDFDGDGIEDDPRQLAQATTDVRRRDPNILEQLLGKGGTGGPLDNPLAKAAFAGIVAFGASRLMDRR